MNIIGITNNFEHNFFLFGLELLPSTQFVSKEQYKYVFGILFACLRQNIGNWEKIRELIKTRTMMKYACRRVSWRSEDLLHFFWFPFMATKFATSLCDDGKVMITAEELKPSHKA